MGEFVEVSAVASHGGVDEDFGSGDPGQLGDGRDVEVDVEGIRIGEQEVCAQHDIEGVITQRDVGQRGKDVLVRVGWEVRTERRQGPQPVAPVPALASSSTFGFGHLATLVRRRPLWHALIVTALVVIGNYSAYTYIAPFLHDARGLGSSFTGLFLLVYGIAGVAGNFAGGWLLARTDSVSMILRALTATLTAALLSLHFVHHPVPLAVAVAVWGAAYSAIPVALQTLILRLDGKESGEATTSTYVLVFNAAIAVGALVGGIAIDASGPLAPLVIGAACSALSALAIGRRADP